nr:DUF2950 family protein [uncultured Enterobacter sp.]
MKRVIIASWLALFALPAAAQQTFDSPDKGASALVEAISTQNEPAMTALLGENWRQYLPQQEVDPEAVARFLRDWKISHRIEQEGNTAHLDVGRDNWQLPLPMVKADAGWQFDMSKAADEILTRTIGRNELSAIEASHAYVQAQQDYFQLHQHYAQKLVSDEGTQDGLYWATQPGEAPSPLGPAFSPPVPGTGYHGYHFRILPQQGGFALIAWPVSYGQTGVMSFMVDSHDAVYQADLGESTAQKADEIQAFKPDNAWQQVPQ